jgi:hypothetical protein
MQKINEFQRQVSREHHSDGSISFTIVRTSPPGVHGTPGPTVEYSSTGTFKGHMALYMGN